jgi:hypothetical protein
MQTAGPFTQATNTKRPLREPPDNLVDVVTESPVGIHQTRFVRALARTDIIGVAGSLRLRKPPHNLTSTIPDTMVLKKETTLSGTFFSFTFTIFCM